MPTPVAFTLDSTDGTTATTASTGASVASTAGGTLVYRASAAHRGSTGVLATSTSAATTFLRFLFSGAVTSMSGATSDWLLLPASLPSAQVNMLSFIDTAGALVGQILYGTTGAVVFSDKSNVNTVIMTAAQAATATKFRFFMANTVGTASTGIAKVQAFNAAGTQVGSTVNLTNANLGTTALKGIHIGVVSSVIATVGFDEVQVVDGSTADPGELVLSTTAPTITPGANQTVTANASVTLNGPTATPSGGATVPSTGYTWTAISWPGASGGAAAPVLTNPTTRTPSYTAGTGRYIWGVTATDSNGNTSSQVFQRVFAPGTAIIPIEVTSNTGWTLSKALDLADSDDTSVARSGAVASGAVLVVRLSPLTLAAWSMSIRSYVESVGGTQRVELLEGATVRKNWGALGPAVTMSDVPLTMTTTELGTITSGNELDLRLTQV